MTVRTRFAPSPTGPLHIGGVRTALFNYLYARHMGGEFLLRIEDTDRERSTEEATRGIIESLDWLGLARDGQTVFQSTRIARHAEVARQLLESGNAYYCYATPEELAAEREVAAKEKRVWRYDGRWRDRDPKDAPPGVKPVIRLKTQRDGDTVLEDLVQGTVRVANAELDDMIILRSDGTPTYNHSVVVDDHDMGITHVIRGDDHLTNTFRQIQVYRGMGWDLPRFAHIPLIHGDDGKKLSKRHGAQFALEFKENGYLPEALCNYLMRLGWSHGDLEIIGREDAIRLFDIVDVNRGASRMDYPKLLNLNGIYIRAADDGWLTRDVMERLAKKPGLTPAPETEARVRVLMPALKDRAKTLVDLASAAVFLAQAPRPDPKAEAVLTPEAKAMLRDLGPALAATDFAVPALDAALRAFADAKGLKLGQVAQPLRVALTGSTVSPGIDATLAALGKGEALMRIAAAAS
ncbi:MAG TPA: glutamate--tRNA ligase [Rhodopila sp.]|uniref:glutamate--tRNA ligase n=1 Tax=Rhodopila sp. TaxID=2480087 RepID=UPI002BEAF4CC|nr:glutamate--tRNA ligase [Rhodopila sp.]HVY13765.1 glutamate--tRNA ligase [Rhodopila sp.]